MCTERHIIFAHYACTPILILKCPAQEFVESQAKAKNRKPPLVYQYCVNFMVTKDLWSGCCKRKAQGACFAERRTRKIEREEDRDDEFAEGSENFGTLRPLRSAVNGNIFTCPSIRHKEEHEWHHLELAPDYRTCPNLRTVEEEDGGCCEMAPGGGCLYAGGKPKYKAGRKETGKGRWDGDDFSTSIKKGRGSDCAEGVIHRRRYIERGIMCTQALIIFARCPCRKTRISTCFKMQDDEYRAWRHFEPIPDYRSCKGLETLEDFNEGYCEMAPGGSCPYIGRTMFDTPQVSQVREDRLGIFPEARNNLWRTVSEPRNMHHQTLSKIGGRIRGASFHSSQAKDGFRVHPASPSFLRQTKTSISTLQRNCNPLHDMAFKASLRTGLENLQRIHNPLDLHRPLQSIEDIEPYLLLQQRPTAEPKSS
ncbi:hypothetical protein N431DRAFT_442286 [Stipitochalara longipes BDJ]|nr:hypothetical protein N431DRAFT_442286 [Stipitochalara longipes BDJ]